MYKFPWLIAFAAIGLAVSHPSSAAEVCNYTPSKMIGSKAAVVGGGAATTAATGLGMKALGLYAIQNGVTGAWMLGSTAAGASAAGTTGIIAGTAGVVGSIGATLMSLPVIVTGAVVAVGIGTYEGACFLADR